MAGLIGLLAGLVGLIGWLVKFVMLVGCVVGGLGGGFKGGTRNSPTQELTTPIGGGALNQRGTH